MITFLLIALCAFAGPYRVGVLVVPEAGYKQMQLAHQLSLRVVRRLDERSAVESVLIPLEHYQNEGLSRASELKRLTQELKTHGNEESAFALSQLLDELIHRPTEGPLIQAASLRLAHFFRNKRDELTKWIELGLKVHPSLELRDGEEWDQSSDYPEIGLQISTLRSRLTRECDLKLEGLPMGAKVELNGFAWNPASKLRGVGPFWMKVNTPRGVFERWVGCAAGPIRVQLNPPELSPSRLLPLFERNRLDGLVIGIAGEKVRFYQVGDSADAVLLESKNADLTTHIETAATELPFRWGALMPVKLEPPPPVAQSDEVAAHRWYNQRKFWWGLGIVAVSAGFVKASGILENNAVPLSGAVE